MLGREPVAHQRDRRARLLEHAGEVRAQRALAAAIRPEMARHEDQQRRLGAVRRRQAQIQRVRVGIVGHRRGIGEVAHHPAHALLRGGVRRQRARQQGRGEREPRPARTALQGRPGTLAPARTNTGMRPSGAFTVSVTGPST